MSKSSGKSTPTPKTPMIHVTHPNVPDCQESLEGSTESEKAIDNPAFVIDHGDYSMTPLPNQYPVFVFDSDCKSLYSRRGSYTADTFTDKQKLTPRRGSQGQTISLAVPNTLNLRRPSDSSASIWSQDTLTANRGGTYGDNMDRIRPPASPGLLSTSSAWSELVRLQSHHSRRSSDAGISDFSGTSKTVSNVSSSLSEHLRFLVRAFSSRTKKVKETTVQPTTPSSDLSDYANSDCLSAISTENPQIRHRLDSFFPPEHPEGDTVSEIVEIANKHKKKGCLSRLKLCCRKLRFPHVIDVQSKFYLFWLFIVTLAFMYNAWVIPLRAVFPYQTSKNLTYWLVMDYTCDFIYVLDIFLIKMRISYLDNGIKETSQKRTRKNYLKKPVFKFDVLSLLPLDLFYLVNMRVNPWLRLPRILKIQTFWEFYSRCDHAVRSAHWVRIIKTMTYMLFLIHLETCGYYAMSVYEGIGTNRWVYSGKGNAYIRCFYLATKTATSIGNNPKPTNMVEYLFMIVYWVSGVFVFALLIGQIRDIVDAASFVKTMYNKRMDAALQYVKNMNLPHETQSRIRSWFIYNWQQQKILDERELMNALPMNLRTDLAIHVHFNTLSKVKLFQDCDKTLLYDLVLKLQPILYLPGDYVCRKGEIGKEMYIVSQGLVEVVGGPDNSLVLATLKEGSVFGEISLLAISTEGNRRTADVRCKGFTNLFILSKTEFETAMKDYPEAHKLLKKRAKKLLRVNAKLQKQSMSSTDQSKINAEEIIKTPPETPKMVKTVIQIMDPESTVVRQLSYRSTRSKSRLEETCPSQEHTKASENNGTCNDNKGFELESEVELSTPSPTEIEAFYDEILRVDDWTDLEQQMQEEAERAILKTIDLVRKSDDSDSNSDSGVQDTKARSGSASTKTFSNKDSKESFMSNDLAELVSDPANEEQASVGSANQKQAPSQGEVSEKVRPIPEEPFKENEVSYGVPGQSENETQISDLELPVPNTNIIQTGVPVDKEHNQTELKVEAGSGITNLPNGNTSLNVPKSPVHIANKSNLIENFSVVCDTLNTVNEFKMKQGSGEKENTTEGRKVAGKPKEGGSVKTDTPVNNKNLSNKARKVGKKVKKPDLEIEIIPADDDDKKRQREKVEQRYQPPPQIQLYQSENSSPDIPAENKVTCFVEVHREKTLSPSPVHENSFDFKEGTSPRRRKISVISIGSGSNRNIEESSV